MSGERSSVRAEAADQARLLLDAAATEGKVTEARLVDALRDMHRGDAWGFLTQVPNATGFSDRVRTADALAMSLWPSRGLELHGFEIKVSRADWAKELRRAAKAEEIARFCDRWWVVAPSGVVRDGELPPTWGLLVWGGGRLTVGMPAPKLSPEPVSRSFLASLFRCLHTPAATPADLAAARAMGAQDAAAVCAEREQRARAEVEQYTRVLADFQEASGVRIDRWDNGKRIGAAVRTVLAGESGRYRQKLQYLRSAVAAAVDELDRAIAGDR